MMQKKETIIVGAGIAGLSIAWELFQQNKSFVIYNHQSNLPSASLVAAGTWNPLNFKRLVPTWEINLFLDSMEKFYDQTETFFNVKCFYPIAVKKILSNAEEVKFWNEMKSKPESGGFIDENFGKFNNETTATIKRTGKVDMHVLFAAFKNWLLQEYCWIEEAFDYDALEAHDGVWHFKYVLEVQHVIFADGVHVKNNPFFNFIDLKPANGDVLTVKIPDLKIDYILKKNIFISPIGNDLYHVGATYNWDNLVWEKSDEARVFLESKLKQIIPYDFEVVGQVAGVRPASRDRRPIIGEHPTHKNLWCYNGLGAKGLLLAPQISKWLLGKIFNNQNFPEDIDIKRYFAK